MSLALFTRRRIVLWLLLFVAVIGASRAFRRYAMIHSKAYETAIYFIDNDSTVRQELGDPQRMTLSSPGQLGDAFAEVAILVDGRKRSGTVFLRLQNKDGTWSVSHAKLTSDSGHFLALR